MEPKEIGKIEEELLLEAIYRRYGYDFRNYARSSLRRRLTHRMEAAKLERISEMIPLVLHDEVFFNHLLTDLSITVTEMFRSPKFYAVLREQIIPVLKTYPFVKIWHAGCATGEEVYSMAIVLQEEDFLDRAQIYATDYNNTSLETASEGIYPIEYVKKFASNYYKGGGKRSFSDYFLAKFQSAKIQRSLKKNIVFSHHNLVTDHSFGQMNVIICRNVLIYFDRTLQNRVLSLFCDSLSHGGFLCLGSKETIDFLDCRSHFKLLSREARIYKKIIGGPV